MAGNSAEFHPILSFGTLERRASNWAGGLTARGHGEFPRKDRIGMKEREIVEAEYTASAVIKVDWTVRSFSCESN
ncbi:hypothetical protein OUZ56_008286 [Daphnia magna]|uniref:Uncharacterized protein n=1 Tax=Daphnia magna TaxID=35525 RepID=A0ABR0ACX3_9CRUS|nr:hypothetical protein OUZ56_008286 [Daphnia magna]